MALSLRLITPSDRHDDLILTIGGEALVCDSYYFAIDGEFMPGREDEEKVRGVLAVLLGLWAAAIESMLDGQVAYLPFDFSDQSMGWMICRRVGREVEISCGWSSMEGWSIWPSAPGDLRAVPRDFQLDGPTARCEMRELVVAIRRDMALIA